MVIRVGIVGLSASDVAWVSRSHGTALKEATLSTKYQLTAVATTSKTSALASAVRWGVPPEKAYTHAEDIVADPDVDLVVIGVKLPLHYEMTLPALNAGKDVFVEWPLATDIKQVKELQAAAKKSAGRAIVGLQARASPTILKAKEIIDSGVLGKVVATTIVGWDNMLLYLPPRFDYEHEAKNRADISTITSGHVLDALCFLLGEFDSLSATSKCFFPSIITPHHKTPVIRDAPDSFVVQGTLKSGTIASLTMILTPPGMPSSFTWTIAGEKGSLKFEADNINIQIMPPKLYWYRSETDTKSMTMWQEVHVDEPLAFGQVGELYEALAYGEKVPGILADFDAAALRHTMLEACAKSARNGTRETYM